MLLEMITPLAAAATEVGSEISKFSEITDKFGIKGRILLAQVINFGIVAFLLWKFAFKPVLNTLDERQKKIADGLQYAEQAKIELAEAEKRQADILQNAQQDAKAIIDEAREVAKIHSEKATQEALTKAQVIIEKSEQTIAREREQMLIEIRQEIADLVVETTAKVLRKKLSRNEQIQFNKAATQELFAGN